MTSLWPVRYLVCSVLWVIVPALVACASGPGRATGEGARWLPQMTGTTASLRGLSVVGGGVVWASGSGGTYLRTTDGGVTWDTGNVPGASDLDFRDVDAVDATTAYLLSAGPGDASRIYKTTDGGRSWALQYINPHPQAFFDGIAFWDPLHGIAYSDPVDGRFLVVTTRDGGANWMPVPADAIPPALPGEAGFAASGTGIVVQGNGDVWFGTGGGPVARVFRSADRGRTWQVSTTPLAAGEAAGVFGLAFRDARHGVAVGGAYTRPGDTRGNVAVTIDGGATWAPIPGTPPAGYRSGTAYQRGTRDPVLIAVGTSGSDLSADGGRSWIPMDSVGFHTVAFGPDGSGWAAGAGGRVARFVSRRR